MTADLNIIKCNFHQILAATLLNCNLRHLFSEKTGLDNPWIEILFRRTKDYLKNPKNCCILHIISGLSKCQSRTWNTTAESRACSTYCWLQNTRRGISEKQKNWYFPPILQVLRYNVQNRVEQTCRNDNWSWALTLFTQFTVLSTNTRVRSWGHKGHTMTCRLCKSQCWKYIPLKSCKYWSPIRLN